MKWTVAIVVVIDVTGLCRADDGGRCSAPRVTPEQRLESCTAVINSAEPTREALVAAYTNRGLAYDRKGIYDRAIADLDEAIRLDPTSAPTYSNRGWAYIGKGSYDRAISDLDEAIRLDPRYTHAYNNRGSAYSAKRSYDLAITDFDKAIRLDPKFAMAYANRG